MTRFDGTWDDLREVVATPGVFPGLTARQRSAAVIPRTAFEDAEAVDDFVFMAKRAWVPHFVEFDTLRSPVYATLRVVFGRMAWVKISARTGLNACSPTSRSLQRQPQFVLRWRRSARRLPDGSFRIITPLLYPDGKRVEIFYQPELDLFAANRLTDKGQTAALLAELNIYIEGFEKRRQILADICRTLRVGDANGELFVAVEANESLPDAVLRLAQACVRAADLHYTQSFRAHVGLPAGVRIVRPHRAAG